MLFHCHCSHCYCCFLVFVIIMIQYCVHCTQYCSLPDSQMLLDGNRWAGSGWGALFVLPPPSSSRFWSGNTKQSRVPLLALPGKTANVAFTSTSSKLPCQRLTSALYHNFHLQATNQHPRYWPADLLLLPIPMARKPTGPYCTLLAGLPALAGCWAAARGELAGFCNAIISGLGYS